MSVGQLAELARRHGIAVCLILLVTAGIAIYFRGTQSGYMETATVALEPGSFVSVEPLNVNQNFLQNTSLVATCQLVVMRLSGPQGEIQLRQAGVTGGFAVSVVNTSNADTPDYPYPDLLVSVAGGSAGTTHDQFIKAMHVIASDISDFQASDKVSTQDRVETYILSDSGPLSQRGSLIRTYAASVFLAIVAMFLICRFLDHRSRAAVM